MMPYINMSNRNKYSIKDYEENYRKELKLFDGN